MLTLTWGFLNKPEVTSALRKLFNANGLPAELAYRAGRLCVRCQKEMENAQKEALKLLKEYAKKDEKGGILGFPDGPFSFDTKELEIEHDRKFLELMTTEFEEKINKFNIHQLDSVKLTPGELLAISPLIEVDDA